MEVIFYIAILVMSVVVHEVAHGFMALRYGDRTALHAGRLTLNPLPHLDPLGSVILPALLALANSPFLIGWAKPVPYNPDNLSDKKWGSIAVASAGVLVNFSVALIFGTLMRFSSQLGLPEGVFGVAQMIVIVNLALGIFNLVPIPPLDGSKILLPLLPSSLDKVAFYLENYAFIFLIAFILFFSDILYPILNFMYSLFTGYAL